MFKSDIFELYKQDWIIIKSDTKLAISKLKDNRQELKLQRQSDQLIYDIIDAYHYTHDDDEKNARLNRFKRIKHFQRKESESEDDSSSKSTQEKLENLRKLNSNKSKGSGTDTDSSSKTLNGNDTISPIQLKKNTGNVKRVKNQSNKGTSIRNTNSGSTNNEDALLLAGDISNDYTYDYI